MCNKETNILQMEQQLKAIREVAQGSACVFLFISSLIFSISTSTF